MRILRSAVVFAICVPAVGAFAQQVKPTSAIDKALVSAIIDAADGATCVQMMREESHIDYSFRNGPDDRLEEMSTVLDADELELSQAKTTDPQKAAAKKELVDVLGSLSEAIDKVTDGFEKAADSDGWTDDATSTANAGYDEADKLPYNGSTAKLTANKSFQRYLPHFYLQSTGLVPDPAGFALGARVFSDDSLFFVSVYSGGLAEKLGFKSLDRILEFDDVKPKDVDQLKQMIKAAKGKSKWVKVKSFSGVETDFQITIPANLGK